MTAIRSALSAVFGIAALAVPATAQELYGTLKKIRDTKTFTIGHREAAIPFAYYDQEKKPVGFAIDLCLRIVEEVKKELKMPNIDVKYLTVNPQTRIPLITNGTVDIECGITGVTLARQQQIDYTYPHYASGERLLVTKTSGIKKLDDLNGKALGIVPGIISERIVKDYISRNKMNVRLVHMRDYAEGMLAMESDRIDALIVVDVVLYSLLAKSSQKDRFEITGQALTSEPVAMMVRRDDSAFRLVANRTLARIYHSGEIYALHKRYFEPFGTPITQEVDWTFKLHAVPE